MNQPTAEDIAALREDGDLKSYLLALTGRAPAPKPAPRATAAEPGYRIAHKGGWPIGASASLFGPSPTHGRCTCRKCEQAAVVQLPRPHEHAEGAAA
ncbi:hypothetical protein AB0D78_28435 [Streptomyces avermitilis]|uniref:hypothetical protein n=1 Tax=Streptomyces avermitilis TaxID=33903 RepID=UPI0033F31F36